ncbi:MAG: hypothetical protein ACXWAC_17215 [Usitatibacter sp.]
MSPFQSLLVLLTTASSFASGQMPAPESMSRRVGIATVLHLDTVRAERVEAILREAFERQREVRALMGPANDTTSRVVLRSALRAVCEDADRQLVEVLGTDDLEKLINPAARPGASI